ncbi:MAG: ribonuclease R [Planctomycetota bacterium]|nr:ribonuclease R [Planctomycetota bacterium]
MEKEKEHGNAKPGDTEHLQQAILDIVRSKNYRPLKPRQIAKRLSVSKEQMPRFKRTVKRMVSQGLLIYGPNHLLEAGVQTGGTVADATKPTGQTAEKATNKTPDKTESKTTETTINDKAVSKKDKTTSKKEKKSKGKKADKKADKLKGNRLVGVFQRTERGFGFVRPRGVDGKKIADRSADVYIPAKRTGDAATGDLVMVQLIKPRKQDQRFDRKPRDKDLGPRGEIVEVLERQTHQFVGTYQESAAGAFVQVDGSIFTEPVYVGDPGAKGVRIDDKVVFEMIRFPSSFREGEGVITEVLGPRGRPGVDTISIIRQFELPDEFAQDAIEEAHRVTERYDNAVPEGAVPEDRLDLTAETIITIDPADARDFDDAISLEKMDNGHWRLGVHIADVSHFVRPRTALDREAVHRGTSVYLPDRVIPMLPEVISNGLASLQPGKVRFTKTAFMEFTPEGVRVSSECHSAAIESKKRLTYEEVDEFLADPTSWRQKLGAEVHGLLGRMHELSRVLRKRRFGRGSLEISLPEVKIDLDKDGQVVGAHETENTESHQIIEEFMLAANEAVAETLRDKELFFLRRIHEQPTPRKLKALTDFVRQLGIRTESLESRFAVQKVIDSAIGRADETAIMFAVLRTMQQAVYGPEEEGHYALASDCYCHFTSPIRRYPDLTVHRLLDSIIRKKPPRNDYDELVALGELCSVRERRAESAERELIKLKLLNYMSSRIGQCMDVVVTGVERFGLFVRGIELPAEGLIRLELLADDNYYYDRDTHTLSGHRTGNIFRLGDRLRAEVARVDLERRELDFRPAGKAESDGNVKPRRSRIPERPTRSASRPAKKSTRRKPKKTARKHKRR